MIPDSAPGGHSIITVDCRELEPPVLKERGMVTHLDTFEDGSIELWIWQEGQ